MNTIKLFEEDTYIKNFSALVQSVEIDGEEAFLVLDKTAFFPAGGGQTCDLGTIDELPVLDVFEKDGLIFHKIPSFPVINAGDSVSCNIEWSRRFKNMQRHCGEHILSGIFFSEYGGVNRGFHMGDEYMTIDISLENNPEFKAITWDMAMHAEQLSNEAIWLNVPVITRKFKSHKEAAKLPLRKPLAIEEDITIVCVGSVENPSDCVACCGTHPKNAGEIGLIKILKIESFKGMFRIYFKAGDEALLDYRNKNDVISKLNNKYSAATFDLLDKIEIQDQKNKALRNELHTLKQLVIKERIASVREDLASSCGITTISIEALKMDDLINIGRSVIDSIPKLLLLPVPGENTVLFFSDGKTVDCGKLVKETADIYNGKGGGNASQARAIFPKPENIETYIDLIEKHLR